MKSNERLREVLSEDVRYSSKEAVTIVAPFLRRFNSDCVTNMNMETVHDLVDSQFIDLTLEKIKDQCGSKAIDEFIALRTESALGVIDAEDFVRYGWGEMFEQVRRPLIIIAENIIRDNGEAILSFEGIKAVLDLKAIEAASTMTMLFV